MGGWWDHYSYRCQPVEYNDHPRTKRVSFVDKILFKQNTNSLKQKLAKKNKKILKSEHSRKRKKNYREIQDLINTN